MARDLRTELREHKGFASTWQPQPGDILIGRIIGFSVGPGQYGDVNIVTILDEETKEELAVWLGSKVLLTEFQRLEPRVGERIGIRYDGKHPDKGYHLYIVRIDRDEEPLRQRGGEMQSENASHPVGTLPLTVPTRKAVSDDEDEIPF